MTEDELRSTLGRVAAAFDVPAAVADGLLGLERFDQLHRGGHQWLFPGPKIGCDNGHN